MKRALDKAEIDKIKKSAARRVRVVWLAAKVLRPELNIKDRGNLADEFLRLSRAYRGGRIRRLSRRITPAQAEEIARRCIEHENRNCYYTVFAEVLAEELNEFYESGEST